MTFGIEFPLVERHAVVDAIIQARSFYLQAGKSGDKISTLFLDKSKQKTNGCILIEVPNMDFDDSWNKLLLDTLKHKYRKLGASKSNALPLAKEQIKKTREIWNIRRSTD